MPEFGLFAWRSAVWLNESEQYNITRGGKTGNRGLGDVDLQQTGTSDGILCDIPSSWKCHMQWGVAKESACAATGCHRANRPIITGRKAPR
ncbi:hypothetical protein MGYG_04910 [Nannizzia gypsea CBS 118893]|uniref:Uncharacterized protein n=1 Tax=Arthroderma gypseum (strain ATCC MYA-4604 / CBS 118893) TaxID=535722 RepID=E4UXG2_ARTGP|nr:hypothetical protein MGYG_04910 [Nannizzia gypsea CBS 118893]EFR01910.1 hypothetical protein MGYG_04910 [Nannizzia gypsea CBS 118893]